MKVAIISTGLGNIRRGFEIFADELFDHLKTEIDVTLFKGEIGRASCRERV